MQKRQINKAYSHYTEMMLALGSQNIMPKEMFVKMCEMMFLFKGNNSNKNFDQIKSWHKAKHNNVEDFKPKHPRPNKEEPEELNYTDQINETLDKILFLKSEINKYKGDTEMTKSLEGALIHQKNKINKLVAQQNN